MKKSSKSVSTSSLDCQFIVPLPNDALAETIDEKKKKHYSYNDLASKDNDEIQVVCNSFEDILLSTKSSNINDNKASNKGSSSSTTNMPTMSTKIEASSNLRNYFTVETPPSNDVLKESTKDKNDKHYSSCSFLSSNKGNEEEEIHIIRNASADIFLPKSLNINNIDNDSYVSTNSMPVMTTETQASSNLSTYFTVGLPPKHGALDGASMNTNEKQCSSSSVLSTNKDKDDVQVIPNGFADICLPKSTNINNNNDSSITSMPVMTTETETSFNLDSYVTVTVPPPKDALELGATKNKKHSSSCSVLSANKDKDEIQVIPNGFADIFLPKSTNINYNDSSITSMPVMTTETETSFNLDSNFTVSVPPSKHALELGAAKNKNNKHSSSCSVLSANNDKNEIQVIPNGFADILLPKSTYINNNNDGSITSMPIMTTDTEISFNVDSYFKVSVPPPKDALEPGSTKNKVKKDSLSCSVLSANKAKDEIQVVRNGFADIFLHKPINNYNNDGSSSSTSSMSDTSTRTQASSKLGNYITIGPPPSNNVLEEATNLKNKSSTSSISIMTTKTQASSKRSSFYKVGFPRLYDVPEEATSVEQKNNKHYSSCSVFSSNKDKDEIQVMRNGFADIFLPSNINYDNNNHFSSSSSVPVMTTRTHASSNIGSYFTVDLTPPDDALEEATKYKKHYSSCSVLTTNKDKDEIQVIRNGFADIFLPKPLNNNNIGSSTSTSNMDVMTTKTLASSNLDFTVGLPLQEDTTKTNERLYSSSSVLSLKKDKDKIQVIRNGFQDIFLNKSSNSNQNNGNSSSTSSTVVRATKTSPSSNIFTIHLPSPTDALKEDSKNKKHYSSCNVLSSKNDKVLRNDFENVFLTKASNANNNNGSSHSTSSLPVMTTRTQASSNLGSNFTVDLPPTNIAPKVATKNKNKKHYWCCSVPSRKMDKDKIRVIDNYFENISLPKHSNIHKCKGCASSTSKMPVLNTKTQASSTTVMVNIPPKNNALEHAAANKHKKHLRNGSEDSVLSKHSNINNNNGSSTSINNRPDMRTTSQTSSNLSKMNILAESTEDVTGCFLIPRCFTFKRSESKSSSMVNNSASSLDEQINNPSCSKSLTLETANFPQESNSYPLADSARTMLYSHEYSSAVPNVSISDCESLDDINMEEILNNSNQNEDDELYESAFDMMVAMGHFDTSVDPPEDTVISKTCNFPSTSTGKLTYIPSTSDILIEPAVGKERPYYLPNKSQTFVVHVQIHPTPMNRSKKQRDNEIDIDSPGHKITKDEQKLSSELDLLHGTKSIQMKLTYKEDSSKVPMRQKTPSAIKISEMKKDKNWQKDFDNITVVEQPQIKPNIIKKPTAQTTNCRPPVNNNIKQLNNTCKTSLKNKFKHFFEDDYNIMMKSHIFIQQQQELYNSFAMKRKFEQSSQEEPERTNKPKSNAP